MNLPPSSRQPTRAAWSRDRLVHERAVALGFALEPSSISSYSSALQSYISFCRLHNFPVEPTPDTLSFFVVYMCSHIKPTSVKSYLSGICNQLEPFFPNVRSVRRHTLVTRTLLGCTKRRATPTSRRRPLSRDELSVIHTSLSTSPDHDDILFLTILSTTFHGLMRLGENVWPDQTSLQDYRKVILRSSVTTTPDSFAFLLPGHKADRLFEGNRILIHRATAGDAPLSAFTNYISSRDHLFALKPELWLRRNGSIPTRHWFLSRLLALLPNPTDIGGHSLRAGGATYYAITGVPSHIIRAMGRWKSDTFEIYIRQHPALLAALLFSSTAQDNPLV
ncbi:hypothetical protein NLJ89_g7033 [Agrocybe chaxingu]|uniref:Tyr recombinase domain-containing protein n=1 Tax=Agrocybe chaxingu TaxID=84603 RepID=A0A9W8JXF6_9AGAR|nr:hypothetical protein NLJ89_g7033 [Agrocybe chaxingu]